ncbi:MAG: DedA family protein [Betaproteobacteria bacterium]
MDFTGLLEEHGYLGLVLGSFIEGETFVVLAGFAAQRGYLSLPLVIVVATLMNFAWDQFYFWLGRRRGDWVMQRFASRRPRIERILGLLERHHAPLIVGVRFMYGFRIIGPIAIGMSAVPWPRFIALNLLGAALWATLFAGLGYLFGDALELALANLRQYEKWLFAALAAIGLSVWLIMGLRRLHHR